MCSRLASVCGSCGLSSDLHTTWSARLVRECQKRGEDFRCTCDQRDPGRSCARGAVKGSVATCAGFGMCPLLKQRLRGKKARWQPAPGLRFCGSQREEGTRTSVGALVEGPYGLAPMVVVPLSFRHRRRRGDTPALWPNTSGRPGWRCVGVPPPQRPAMVGSSRLFLLVGQLRVFSLTSINTNMSATSMSVMSDMYRLYFQVGLKYPGGWHVGRAQGRTKGGVGLAHDFAYAGRLSDSSRSIVCHQRCAQELGAPSPAIAKGRITAVIVFVKHA